MGMSIVRMKHKLQGCKNSNTEMGRQAVQGTYTIQHSATGTRRDGRPDRSPKALSSSGYFTLSPAVVYVKESCCL